MSNDQDLAFQQLLAEWRRHEDLRNSGADINELFASREVLDQRRLVASSAR